MMQGEYSVSLKDMIEALKLENFTPDVDINKLNANKEKEVHEAKIK